LKGIKNEYLSVLGRECKVDKKLIFSKLFKKIFGTLSGRTATERRFFYEKENPTDTKNAFA
jgi:hypothetical protein